MSLSLDELNARYAGSSLSFALQNGFPVAEIKTPEAKAKVSLYGGHVMEWTPKGKKDVLWVCPNEPVIAGGRAIRGGVPVCWPWFGAHKTDSSKPMHGSARVALWDFENFDGSTIVLSHKDPSGLCATLRATIGKTLDIVLETVNNSSSELSFNAGLHTYFGIGGREKLLIKGFEGIPYFDKLTLKDCQADSGPLAIIKPTTHVYRGVEKAVIDDPEMKRKIKVGASGGDAIVVWNPGPGAEKLFPGFNPGDENRFVCVESAIIDPIVLKPGEKNLLGTTAKL